MFSTFLSLIVIRTPWGIVLGKGGVARKLGLFKMLSCLGPIAYTYNLDSSVFYEFDELNIIFKCFGPFPLNYDQNTLEFCFSERWCCQKIMPIT